MSYSGLAAGERPRKELVFCKDLGDSSEAHKLLDVNVLCIFSYPMQRELLRHYFQD